MSCGEDTYEKGYEYGKISGEHDGYWKDYHGESYKHKKSLFNENPSQTWLNGYEAGYEEGYRNEEIKWNKYRQ